ncbi:MAG: hypothetical protein OEY89_16570, partial [Gammaproteobacteria bacterium]|nr:hypothetical protein [Gammaproteobacteria bacterium]
MLRKYRYKLLLLGLLVAAALLLKLGGLLEPEMLIERLRGYAGHWWLAVALVLLQVILFTFALAGSSILWVAATLYSPLMSCIILTAGASLGGVFL